MGEGSETIAASSGDSQNNGPCSCEAHHVRSSPQEDCGISAGEVSKSKAAEEGRLAGA
jgi:hypothetical protein